MSKMQPVPYKCYIDGDYYKTLTGYSKDLQKHMLDGSWEKAMIPDSSENRRYLYNFRAMNSKFIPNQTPNKLHKSEIVPLHGVTILGDMMRRYEQRQRQ